jgi:hypothetical protein
MCWRCNHEAPEQGTKTGAAAAIRPMSPDLRRSHSATPWSPGTLRDAMGAIADGGMTALSVSIRNF